MAARPRGMGSAQLGTIRLNAKGRPARGGPQLKLAMEPNQGVQLQTREFSRMKGSKRAQGAQPILVAGLESALRTIAKATPGLVASVFAAQSKLALEYGLRAGKPKSEVVDRVYNAGAARGLDPDYIQQCLAAAVKHGEAELAADAEGKANEHRGNVVSLPQALQTPHAIAGERKEREANNGDDQEPDEQTETPRQPLAVLPPPTNPMAVARRFVEHCCLHNGAAGEKTLRCHQGGWWAWRTTHWTEVGEKEVRALLYAFCEHAVYSCKLNFEPWLPTRKKIGDLMEALNVLLLLPRDTEQPCWLDHRDITGPVVATTNGLLDISTRKLHPHSPMFFNITSVPFAYDLGAPDPQRWLDFLGDLWPQEPDAIAVLGEWYGYVNLTSIGASGRSRWQVPSPVR
jgi:hypothetical protein